MYSEHGGLEMAKSDTTYFKRARTLYTIIVLFMGGIIRMMGMDAFSKDLCGIHVIHGRNLDICNQSRKGAPNIMGFYTP